MPNNMIGHACGEDINSLCSRMEKKVKRREGVVTASLLVVLTIAMGIATSHLRPVTDEQQRLQQRQATEQASDQELEQIPESPTTEELLPYEDDEEQLMAALPFDLGQRMREWLAKKQLAGNWFYVPPGGKKKMSEYSVHEVLATIPHFTRELLLVMYAGAADEFTVLLPGRSDRPAPKCEGGCARIENIMRAILFAFRNRFPHRFQRGGEDLMFLVSTGDYPHLSRKCLERPGDCGRRRAFAPILHFGSAFRNETILPSLVLMPPPPRMHLRCMSEWQINHEVCEFLLPKRVTGEGAETRGIVFGEHVNYKNTKEAEGDLGWEDLIPQVVWRGNDFPYLNLLYPELRPPDYGTDVEPRLREYGRGVGGIIRALNDVHDLLRPRWKAVVVTAQAEFEANAKNRNPKRKKKVLPWANMKFSAVDSDHAKRDASRNEYHRQWNGVGIPAMGEEIPVEEMAKYKYHIDLGGGGGTSSSGTIQKLALPGLLFHHTTAAKDWYHEHIVPWIHYVPIKEDLSDLREQFEWAELHGKKARDIAKAGTDFVRRLGRPEGIDELYRRHFLKPLERVMEAFQPMAEMSPDLLVNGDHGLKFTEVMRCSGHDIDECRLLQ